MRPSYRILKAMITICLLGWGLGVNTKLFSNVSFVVEIYVACLLLRSTLHKALWQGQSGKWRERHSFPLLRGAQSKSTSSILA